MYAQSTKVDGKSNVSVEVDEDTAAYHHKTDLPEVGVRAVMPRKPIKTGIDVKKMSQSLEMQKASGGVNLLGAAIYGVKKLFGKTKKESKKERARRLIEQY